MPICGEKGVTWMDRYNENNKREIMRVVTSSIQPFLHVDMLMLMLHAIHCNKQTLGIFTITHPLTSRCRQQPPPREYKDAEWNLS